MDDYSELVSALETRNNDRANELIKKFYPRLIAFLRIHMNADQTDAEDSVQEALLLSIEAIHNGKVKDPKSIIPYMLTITRNSYLKLLRDRKEPYLEELSADYEQYSAPRQLESLFEDDKKRILARCLEEMKETYRTFMQYWFDHPNAHAEKVADIFGISVNSVWTRKHRLIRQLNECYRKKNKI